MIEIALLEGLIIGAVFLAWGPMMLRLERRIAAINELRRVTTLGFAFRDTLPLGSPERRAVHDAFMSLDIEGATGLWRPQLRDESAT